MTTAPAHDKAVALCCDAGYFPVALFVVRQIAWLAPDRRFDLVIASQEDLSLPAWAKTLGVRLHRLGALPEVQPPKRFQGSLSPYFRLMLARDLGADYRRILYLDSDVFVEAGDIDRLLDADLGPHPLAAARDAPQLYTTGHHALEFKALGWPAYRYANSGVLLIDTAAFVACDLDRRAWDMYPQNAARHVYADQSLLNLALKGSFAELSPVWNWQLSGRLPWMTAQFPVHIRHFIGEKKPFLHADDPREARYRQAYAEHFRQFDPAAGARLPSPPGPAFDGARRLLQLAVWHVQARPIVSRLLALFPDPYRPLVVTT